MTVTEQIRAEAHEKLRRRAAALYSRLGSWKQVATALGFKSKSRAWTIAKGKRSLIQNANRLEESAY